MIIVCLKGGLGNQMFQYAAGRRLACTLNVALKLDLTWYGQKLPGITPRVYSLDPFSIHAEPATDKEIGRLYEPQVNRISRFINSVNPCYRKTYIRDLDFRFDPDILGLPDNSYLDGYWQSEKYFCDVVSVIRSDFTVRMAAEKRNREIASIIDESNAISIHIRRGDYVVDDKITAKHVTCSNDYYKKAVELVMTQVERPHFFVFSDDPAWVRENFSIPHTMTVVDHNGPEQGHEDLRLMRMCKHHVIANSSFSWWGAWLGNNPDKMVIAPRRWFSDESIDTADIIPSGWVRI
jgi:hypothetical protein